MDDRVITMPKPVSKPPQSVKSFKVVVNVENEWVENGLRFPDEQQATRYAEDLSARWVKVKQYDIQPTGDEPNAQMLRFGSYEKAQDAPEGV